MKNIILSPIFLFLTIQFAFSQTLSKNSTIYPAVKAFFLKGYKDTTTLIFPQVYHVNILDSTQNSFGVFKFGKESSEGRPYIYLRNYGENNIEIIEDYQVEYILIRILAFFERNKSHIVYYQKVRCLKKVLQVMDDRIDYSLLRTGAK